MLTAEKIKLHYRGPHTAEFSHTIIIKFMQKGRRWPRINFHLHYSVTTRVFVLKSLEKRSPKSRAIVQTSENPALVDAFRSAIPPELLARCASRSIIASENQKSGPL